MCCTPVFVVCPAGSALFKDKCYFYSESSGKEAFREEQCSLFDWMDNGRLAIVSDNAVSKFLSIMQQTLVYSFNIFPFWYTQDYTCKTVDSYLASKCNDAEGFLLLQCL